MPNNSGREEIFSPEIWNEIDKAVMSEVGRLRIGQKVFPALPMLNGANVPADVLTHGGQGEKVPMIQEGITKPFMEISSEFALTQGQVDNETTLHTAQTLARRAARSVAMAEDYFILQGSQAPVNQLVPGVQVTNSDSVGAGLLNLQEAQQAIQVPPLTNGQNSVWGENTFAAVGQGIGVLTGAGHPGPYALILQTMNFADTYAPAPNTLITTADRISPLVEGRFYSSGTLPDNTGLLVSLGGDPTTIYFVEDPRAVYTQKDPQGNYRFRVSERVQIVTREPGACVRLEFGAPPGAQVSSPGQQAASSYTDGSTQVQEPRSRSRQGAS